MIIRKFITGLLVSCGLLVALNWCCGWIVRDTYVHLDIISSDDISVSHTVFVPHQQKRLLFPGLKPYRVTINNLGFRGPDVPATKTPGAYRILCLGDSFTFGLFSNDEDTYPWQLQAMLDPSHRAVQVLNAGLGSTTVSDHLYYLQRWGMDLAPDLVIVQVCSNDLHEILQNTTPYYEKVMQEQVHRGLDAWIRRLKRTRLYRTFVLAEVHWMYFHDVMRIKDARYRRILLSRSRNRDDVIYARHFEAPGIVLSPEDPRWHVNWERYIGALDALIDYTNQRHLRMVVVLIPGVLATLRSVQPVWINHVAAHLAARHVTCLNLLPVLQAYGGDPLALFNDPPRDYHLSRQGYRLLAEQLEPLILVAQTSR